MLELVISALQAILQVITIVLFGVILTKTGHFDSSKQKWLSRLNLTFFTPCLLFSNIASTISLEKLVTLWPIPVFFCAFILVSWLAALWMLRLLRIQGDHRQFVIACTMFCNTNSLPIAIITSLAFSEAGHLLYWCADDTQQDVAARGVAYTIFYAMFCNIVRWSYGYHLLQQPQTAHDDDRDFKQQQQQQHLRYPEYSTTAPTTRYDTQYIEVDNELTPAPSSMSKSAHETSPLLPICHNSTDTLSSLRYQTLPCWIGLQIKAAALIFHANMSPPLYAALLGLVVGLSPVQPLLFNKHAFLYPSVTKAVQSCGKVAVPLILVCLGSQLTFIAKEKKQQQQQQQSISHRSSFYDHSSSSFSSRRAVVASLVARMMIAPLLVIGIVLACLKYTAIDLLQDPVFVVALIILGCTPTAINLSQISQVSEVFEEEMLQVLFWSYGVICVPVMTAIVFIALKIVEK
ncbi:auxin efflux carrier [Absidia repens]|uniref:Auxin efflux carrier n=1 Tax=Absidia repens TaxID=90262 RepID=A0A1X2I206_9FUNG|nr:auxin efflux carrier [Absidia repens]